MGKIMRQGVWTTIFAYLGVILGYLNTLVLYPKFLSNEEIGLVRTLISGAMFIVPLSLFGFSSVALRFLPKYRAENKPLNGLFSMYFIFGIGGISLVTCILILLKEPISAYYAESAEAVLNYLDVGLALVLAGASIQLLDYWGRANSIIILPNFLKDVILRVGISSMLILFFFGILDYSLFLSLLPVLYLLNFLILLLNGVNKGIFKFKLHLTGFFNKRSKEIWTYAGFTIVGSLGSLLILSVDIQMISGMVGLEATGIYTTCFYMATIIEMPQRAISQVMTPVVSFDLGKENFQKIKEDYRKISIYQATFGSLLLLGVMANLSNIFEIIPRGQDFLPGFYIVLLIGLSKLINMFFSINGVIIGMSQYYRFNLLSILVLGLCMVALNLWLIPMHGINGAAAASLISVFTYGLSKLTFVYIKFGFHPFSNKTIKLVVIIFFTGAIAYFLPSLENIYLDSLYKSLLISIVYSSIVWKMKLVPEVFSFILRKIKFQ